MRERLRKQKKIKILIVRLKPAGDTILVSAVFRNLKRLYPGALIDIVLYPASRSAAGANPHIRKVIVLKRNNLSKFLFYLKLPFLGYDVTIDFINNPTSGLITLFSMARIRIGRDLPRNFFYSRRVGQPREEYSALASLRVLKFLGLKNFNDYMPEYFIPEEDKITAEKIMNRLGVRPKERLAGIFASAKYPTRQYPASSFARLAQLVRRDFKVRVLFLFGKGDRDAVRTIKKSFADKKGAILVPDGISIGTMAAIMKKLNYLITGDTGPKHLGTAMNIPTLTIFGATDERVWNPPDRKRFAVVRSAVSCAPCQALSCAAPACMRDLQPEVVYKTLKPLLKKYLR